MDFFVFRPIRIIDIISIIDPKMSKMSIIHKSTIIISGKKAAVTELYLLI